MKVYSPDDYSWVPALESPAEKGEEFDVDAEVGEALVEQGWTSARQKAAKKVGRARHRAAVEAETVDPDEQFAATADDEPETEQE
jgi:glucose dehydrogenase